MTDTTPPDHSSVIMTEEVFAQVLALSVSALRQELRKRKLNGEGIVRDLRWRLMDALKSEYANGWTRGHLLNIKIIPFDGRGRDPQTLVGRHVTGLRAKGSNRLTIMLSDGPDETVVYQTSKFQSPDDNQLHLGLSGGLIRLLRRSSNKPQTHEEPLLITEAATAVCKNYQGEEAATIIGIKLAGMKEMAFFNMSNERRPGFKSWAKLGVNIRLAGDGDAGLESGGALFPANDKPIKIKDWRDGVHYEPLIESWD